MTCPQRDGTKSIFSSCRPRTGSLRYANRESKGFQNTGLHLRVLYLILRKSIRHQFASYGKIKTICQSIRLS